MKRNKNITIIKKAYRVWSYEIEDALEFGIELANKILEKRKKYGII